MNTLDFTEVLNTELMDILDFPDVLPISTNQQNTLTSNNLSNLYIKEVTHLITSGKMFEKAIEIVPEGKQITQFFWPAYDLILIESARRIWDVISSEFSKNRKGLLIAEMLKIYKTRIVTDHRNTSLISAIFFKSLIQPKQLAHTYKKKLTSDLEIPNEYIWGNIIELYNSGHTFKKSQGKSMVIEKDPILHKYFSELAQKYGVIPKKPERIHEFRSKVDGIDNKKRKERPDGNEKPFIRKKDKQEKLDFNSVIEFIKFGLEDVNNDISKINWKLIAQIKEGDIPAIKTIWEIYLRDLESKVSDKNSMCRLRRLVSMCDKDKPIDWEWIQKLPSNLQKSVEMLNLEWQQSVLNSSTEFFDLDLIDIDSLFKVDNLF